MELGSRLPVSVFVHFKAFVLWGKKLDEAISSGFDGRDGCGVAGVFARKCAGRLVWKLRQLWQLWQLSEFRELGQFGKLGELGQFR